MRNIVFSPERSCLDIKLPHGNAARLEWHPSEAQSVLRIELPYAGAYGLGEKFNGINQKGRVVTNKVEEKFCFQGEKTYCAAPFFWTDTGFGLYVHTGEVTEFKFHDDIELIYPGRALLSIFTGSPADIIREYQAIFGKAALPPKWAFGPWISANRWSSQADVEKQRFYLKQHDYPATVLVLEAWSDEATFYIFNGAKYEPAPDGAAIGFDAFDFSGPWPDPKAMIDALHFDGIRLVLWQIPVYKKQGGGEAPDHQNELDRDDAAKRGLCALNPDGSPYTIPEGHWFAGSMIPDFTNPETVKTWFQKRKYLLDMGVDGFKTDGGEFIYNSDVRFFDGSTGKKGVNRYAQDYAQAYTDFIGPNRVLFSRAGYAGAHRTPLLWAGDQQSQNAELKSVLSAGLSAAASGIPFWGFDIGGFAGPLPNLDLYRRATQLATFCPVMQWHSEPDGGQFSQLLPGAQGNNERSPWNMASAYNTPEFIDEMRFWHNLRMNLLPYIYSTAMDCEDDYRPMIRPLVYVWPGDPDARAAEDQFMLGDSLMVAPFMEEDARERMVYFPEGGWYNLFSEAYFHGGSHVTVGGDGQIPVFLRAGAAIALNMDDSKSLGCGIGNSTTGYKRLHFLLAGERGTYHFRDDLGSDLNLAWEEEQVKATGQCGFDYTWEVLWQSTKR